MVSLPTVVMSVSVLGWCYGFFGAGIVGLIGALIVWKFFHDTPESQGFLPVNIPKDNDNLHIINCHLTKSSLKSRIIGKILIILPTVFLYLCFKIRYYG